MPMTGHTSPRRRPTLANQIAWARGQATQQARLAARATDNSATRQRALIAKAMAEATARSLLTLQSGHRE